MILRQFSDIFFQFMIVCVENDRVQEWSDEAENNCNVFSGPWEVFLVDYFSPVDYEVKRAQEQGN